MCEGVRRLGGGRGKGDRRGKQQKQEKEEVEGEEDAESRAAAELARTKGICGSSRSALSFSCSLLSVSFPLLTRFVRRYAHIHTHMVSVMAAGGHKHSAAAYNFARARAFVRVYVHKRARTHARTMHARVHARRVAENREYSQRRKQALSELVLSVTTVTFSFAHTLSLASPCPTPPLLSHFASSVLLLAG